MQIVFHDPYFSLNPRLSAGTIDGEPLDNFRLATSREKHRARVAHLFIGVGMEAENMQRYPQEFSGGQRQRLGIAKARAGYSEAAQLVRGKGRAGWTIQVVLGQN